MRGRRTASVLVLMLTSTLPAGCQHQPDGVVSRDGLLAAPAAITPTRRAEVDAGAYAAYAAAVGLHARSDALIENLVDSRLPVAERIRMQQQAKGLWDRAARHYLVALARDPKSVDVCSGLARGYVDRGDTVQGTHYLKRALKLDPNDFMLRFRLAMCHEDSRRFDEAIAAYAAATDARVDEDKRRMLPFAVLRYANLCAEHNQLEKAVVGYRRFLALRREDDEVYGNQAGIVELMKNPALIHRTLGRILARLNRHAESAQAFREAYKLTPEVTGSLMQVALAWRDAKRYDRANAVCVEYLDVVTRRLWTAQHRDLDRIEDATERKVERAKLLRMQRDLLRGVRAMVEIYQQRTGLNDPLVAAERCLAGKPTAWQLGMLIGGLYEEKKDLAKAAEAYEKIVRARRPLVMAYLKAVAVEAARKRYDRVLAGVADGYAADVPAEVLHDQLERHLDAAAKVPGIVAGFGAAVDAARRHFGYHYVLGRLHETLENNDAAAKAFAEAVQRKTDFAEGYVALASVHFVGRKQPDDARKVLETATKHVPDNLILWRFLADVQAFGRDFAAAAASMQRVVDIDPTGTGNQLFLVSMMHHAGKTDEAEAYVRREMARDGDHAERWYYILGSLYVDYVHDVDRGIATLEDGAARYPRSYEIVASLGDAYLRKPDYPRAVEVLRKAVDLEPGSVAARLELATALERDGKPDDAEDALRAVRRMYPRSTRITLTLAQFLARTGRKPEESIALVKKLIADDPTGTANKVALGSIYLKLKKYADAVRTCQEVLAAHPDDADARRMLAAAYDEMNQLALAEVHLRECLRRNPKDDLAANTLGYIYAERAVKLDEAEKLLTLALEVDPENGAYLDSMAWVFYKKGDFKKAVDYLKRAAQREPDAVIVDHLGDAYFRLGSRDVALAHYAKAAKMDVYHETRSAEKIERIKAGKDPLGDDK